MRTVGRSVVRIDEWAAGSLLKTLVQLRDHVCTRALCVGLQATATAGRHTIVVLIKTRVRSGQRDYMIYDRAPYLGSGGSDQDATRYVLEQLAADWPLDRPMFVFNEIVSHTRNLDARLAAQRLFDEEKALINPADLPRWHAHWIGQSPAPAVDRADSPVRVNEFFGARIAAATALTAVLSACSTTADFQGTGAARAPRFVTPISFHMHQPSDAMPVLAGTPPSGANTIPRTGEGTPLALHMHQPGGATVSANASATSAAIVANAPRPVSSSRDRSPSPLALHMHQPMSPLVLAEVTTTAARSGLPQTAATEPVKVPAFVLAPEAARAPALPVLPATQEAPSAATTLALAPTQAAENLRRLEQQTNTHNARSAPSVAVAPVLARQPASIFFGRGLSMLSNQETALLRAVAEEAQSSQRIVITGRTDLSGAQRSNEMIGLARAARVKTALIKLGVDPARIEVRVDISGRAQLPRAVRVVNQPSDAAGMLRRVDIELN